MANVQKIRSTRLPGVTDDGGGNGPNPSLPPNVNVDMGVGGEIPNIENISGGNIGEPPPIQAYVVENDISDAQALQEELDIQSTL